MVRVETPRMSARRRAVIFPRACSSSVIANNRSVFSMIFILAQKNVKRVTDSCHVFSVRLKMPTRGMEASQSQPLQATGKRWPGTAGLSSSLFDLYINERTNLWFLPGKTDND